MTTRYTTHFLLSAALLLGAAQNVSAFEDDAFFSEEKPSFSGLFQAPKPSVAQVPPKATQPVHKTNNTENLFNAEIADIQPLHNNDLLETHSSNTSKFKAAAKVFFKQQASNVLKHTTNALGAAGNFVTNNAPAALDHTANALSAAGNFVTNNAPAALDHTANALSAAGHFVTNNAPAAFDYTTNALGTAGSTVMTGAKSTYAYMIRPVESEETEENIFAAEQMANLSLKPNPLPEVEGPTMSEKAGNFFRSAKDAVVTGAQKVHARLTQPTQMGEAADSNIFAADPGFENAVSETNIFSKIKMPEVTSIVPNLFSTNTENPFDVDTQDWANLSLEATPLPQLLVAPENIDVARPNTTTQHLDARTPYAPLIAKSTSAYKQLRAQSRI